MSNAVQLSRRSFLGGALAVVAATTIPLTKTLPIIYGDGIHDDTAGLNALFNRKPVDIIGDKLTLIDADRLVLRGGTFVISDTVRIRRPDFSLNANCIKMIGPADRVMLDFETGPGEFINNVILNERYGHSATAITMWRS